MRAISVAVFLAYATNGYAAAWENGDTVLAVARAALPTIARGVAIAHTPETQGWLKQCTTRLRAQVTARSEWASTVQVTCAQPRWSIYVPFQWHYRERVAVALHFLPAGAVIEAGEVTMKILNINSQSGPVCTRASQVVGQDVRVNVLAGSPISPADLEQPLLVRQGQRIVLEARFGNVVSRASGTAMENGRPGQSLLVRNNASKKILTGVVRKNGTVLLSPEVAP